MRIAYRTHKDGLILVTDAISALGLQDGIHFIGQLSVEVRGIKAHIAGTETLCGSIAPLDECIRIFQKSTGEFSFWSEPTLLKCDQFWCFSILLDCPIVYALEAASLHPAKCLRIEKQKGTIDFGADADLVILNDDLTIRSTWIAGKCLYNASSWTANFGRAQVMNELTVDLWFHIDSFTQLHINLVYFSFFVYLKKRNKTWKENFLHFLNI